MTSPTEEQTYREGIQNMLNDILARATYTNGKVRWMEKVIYALGGALLVFMTEHNSNAATFIAHIFGL